MTVEKVAFQEAFCFGKHGYDSYKQAESVAKRQNRDFSYAVYHCTKCHKWHLGNHTNKLKYFNEHAKKARQLYKEQEYD